MNLEPTIKMDFKEAAERLVRLGNEYEAIEHYQNQIRACEGKIEKLRSETATPFLEYFDQLRAAEKLRGTTS